MNLIKSIAILSLISLFSSCLVEDAKAKEECFTETDLEGYILVTQYCYDNEFSCENELINKDGQRFRAQHGNSDSPDEMRGFEQELAINSLQCQ